MPGVGDACPVRPGGGCAGSPVGATVGIEADSRSEDSFLLSSAQASSAPGFSKRAGQSAPTSSVRGGTHWSPSLGSNG
eukprot:9501320-Pyramimonas_sp.AAC.1